MTTFATRLREYRTARSLTQEELAERARLTAKAVGLLERGVRRRPYPHAVRALADGPARRGAGSTPAVLRIFQAVEAVEAATR